jgi:hypothetical protein
MKSLAVCHLNKHDQSNRFYRFWFSSFPAVFLTITLLLNVKSIPAQDIALDANNTVWPVQITAVNLSVQEGMRSMGGGGMGITTAAADVGMMTVDEPKILLLIKCQNNTDKEVKTIYWESIFLDTKQQPILKQYKSKKKIKPSKNEDIEEKLDYDTNLIPKSIKLGYRIVKIEYSDNSVWENPVKDTTETSFIYKNYKLT